MKKSNKLIFFGNERLASGLPPIEPRVLPALIASGYDIRAVVISDKPTKSRTERPLEVADIAKQHSIPVLNAPLKQIRDELAAFGAEAGVLVAYGQLVPQAILDLFPAGIINLHPSLLPAYRGPTPIEQAILDGATQSGISLMLLTAEMDAGPVFVQQTKALAGSEQKNELADWALEAGSRLLVETLPKILGKLLLPVQQNNRLATYTKLLKKSDSWINFDQPAELVERQIRAYDGWPKTRAELNGRPVIITRARIASSLTDGDLVMAAEPGFIEILQLIAPSGRQMSGADFQRGYQPNK